MDNELKDPVAAVARGIESIDAGWLRDALFAGIHRVIGKRDFINRINVFPVADADTGTNLAFTLHTVAVGASRREHDSISEFSRWIADLALDGARGNSGAIFAQFLQGFAEGTEERRSLDAKEFGRAIATGARSAHAAIADPREGTMLSVMRDYALELESLAESGIGDFAVLLDRGLLRARESLANTPNLLEVLRQNNVVDAGAQGFVELLEGMQEYVRSGSLTELIPGGISFVADEKAPDPVQHVPSEHRYCSECIVSGEKIDRHILRDRILKLGASSLVIAGTKRKVRVHVHVDNPGAFFLACEEFGTVSSQKADDMLKQQHAAHNARRKVAVVVDTGADIPEDALERLNIHVVPLRVNFGDRQYLDKVSLTPNEFYALFRAAAEPPRTSQPPPGDFRRIYEFLLSHFEQGVVCISISGALSGTWQAANGAARRSDAEKIRVFDTLDASAGQALIAMSAAEAAEDGADLVAVQSVALDAASRTRTLAMIPDLSFGVRGGRLPAWVQRTTDLLRLVPIIGNDEKGRIRPRGALLRRGDISRRFARWVARRLDRDLPYRMLIAHCDNAAGARVVRDELVRSFPRVHSIFLTEAGSALGAHAGPGAVIVGVQEYRTLDEALDGARGRS